ncbi:MAG: DNA repair exonuclease [Bacteroidales bacterium]|nr:DNA repair exonuclease [Bacteroidales bacterium]
MMKRVRFIHTADLHLDTPFKGLANWNRELAARLKDATFHSFEKIIDSCITENVDFLIISGDIFDSESKSLSAQLRFVSGLKKLSGKGIATYFVCGNHDHIGSWINAIRIPDNVFRFDAYGVEHYTHKRGKDPVADLYGVSYGKKAVGENLALEFRIRENASPVSIAILHGTVGIPGPHRKYAPFRMEDVMNRGFDYWALGHIHKRKIVHDSHPAVVYPGNTQGRDFGETGTKGCCLVEIIPGINPSMKFVPTHMIRFEEVGIDLSGVHEAGKLQDKIQESRIRIDDYNENDSYILRITFTGRTPLHAQLNKPEEIRQLMDFFNEGQLERENFTWIDQISVRTNPDIDIDQIRKGSDFTADLLQAFEVYEQDEVKQVRLIQELDEDINRYAVKRETSEIDANERTELFEKAKWMLLDQILGKA